MFAQVRVPILGHGREHELPDRSRFGRAHRRVLAGRGQRTAEAMKVAYLGELALQPEWHRRGLRGVRWLRGRLAIC